MKSSVKVLESVNKYKFLILLLCAGLILLLLPTRGSSGEQANTDEQRLASILESTERVGETKVLLSESGAVIVCEGADAAEVRLTVLKAAEAFTGLSGDRIQILRLDRED